MEWLIPGQSQKVCLPCLQDFPGASAKYAGYPLQAGVLRDKPFPSVAAARDSHHTRIKMGEGEWGREGEVLSSEYGVGGVSMEIEDQEALQETRASCVCTGNATLKLQFRINTIYADLGEVGEIAKH